MSFEMEALLDITNLKEVIKQMLLLALPMHKVKKLSPRFDANLQRPSFQSYHQYHAFRP